MEKSTFIKKNMWVEKQTWDRFTSIAERLGMKQWGLLKTMVENKEKEIENSKPAGKTNGSRNHR